MVEGDELALIDDGGAMAELFGFFEVVSGKKDCGASGVEFFHVSPKAVAQFDIDAGGGFVEDDDFGFVDEGLGD